MFSAKIVLVGCDKEMLPEGARDILRRWGALGSSFPTIKAALSGTAYPDSDLRLYVIHASSDEILPELKLLTIKFPGQPVLALVDSTTSDMTVRVVRAGATQVVALPVKNDDLQEALDAITAHCSSHSRLAKTIAVTGAAGGMGATSIALNLSNELASLRNLRCVLVELALRKGNLGNYLDVTPRYTTASLAAQMNRVDGHILQGALTEVANNLSVIVGPYEAIEQDAADIGSVLQLLQAAQHLCDLLIVDVPSSFDDLFFQTLSGANHVVLVTDQTVSSLRGAQLIVNALGQHRPVVVVNRYNPEIKGLTIQRLAGVFPDCVIHPIELDLEMIDSCNKGCSLRVFDKHSPALASIDALADEILPEEKSCAKRKKRPTLLRRLSRVLSLS